MADQDSPGKLIDTAGVRVTSPSPMSSASRGLLIHFSCHRALSLRNRQTSLTPRARGRPPPHEVVTFRRATLSYCLVPHGPACRVGIVFRARRNRVPPGLQRPGTDIWSTFMSNTLTAFAGSRALATGAYREVQNRSLVMEDLENRTFLSVASPLEVSDAPRGASAALKAPAAAAKKAAAPSTVLPLSITGVNV